MRSGASDLLAGVSGCGAISRLITDVDANATAVCASDGWYVDSVCSASRVLSRLVRSVVSMMGERRLVRRLGVLSK